MYMRAIAGAQPSLCAIDFGLLASLACALFIQAGFAISSMQSCQRRILLPLGTSNEEKIHDD
jgi:hypothetical protein